MFIYCLLSLLLIIYEVPYYNGYNCYRLLDTYEKESILKEEIISIGIVHDYIHELLIIIYFFHFNSKILYIIIPCFFLWFCIDTSTGL